MNRILNIAFIFVLSLYFVYAVPTPLRAQAQPAGPPPAPVAPAPTNMNIDASTLEKCYLTLRDSNMCSRLVAEQADWVVRFFEVKYSDLGALRDTLSIFRANVGISSSLHVLSVKAPKEIMPAIEDAVKRLDVPPVRKKNVEVTIYVLGAADGQVNAAEGEAAVKHPLPQVLQPVVNQLKNLFSYKDVQLVDTIVLVGEDGQRVSTQGRVPSASFLAKSLGSPSYSFYANLQVQMPDQKEAVVRMSSFSFSLGNVGGSGGNASINTAVEVQPGQQVVVGKATVGDSALILVLSVKLL